MRIYKIIVNLIIIIFLLSNLSLAQTDSLKGSEVTVFFHKTKNSVTGTYQGYKNNRVTVLFDNSLHDYLYPNVERLEFRGLTLTFDEKGNVVYTKPKPVEKNQKSTSKIKRKKGWRWVKISLIGIAVTDVIIKSIR